MSRLDRTKPKRGTWKCRVALTLACALSAGETLIVSQTAWAAPPLALATGAQIVESNEDKAAIVVHFDKPPTFHARLTQNRLRLIVDVGASGVSGAPAALVPENGVVSGVMIQGFTEPQATTRVIITLKKALHYSVTAQGNDLRISLANDEQQLKATKVAAPAPVAAAVALVRGVNFERHGQEDRVTLDVGASVKFEQSHVSPTSTRLLLSGAGLPDELERTLDVRAFGGSVTSISSYRKSASSVVLDVEHRSNSGSRVVKTPSGLDWVFFEGAVPSSVSGVGPDGMSARRTKTIFVEDLTGAKPKSEAAALLQSEEPNTLPNDASSETDSASGNIPTLTDGESSMPQSAVAPTNIEATTSEPDRAAGFGPTLLGQPSGRYSGRRIDMDFKDADVHNVLRLIADAGRVNIVAADNVSGSVTIRMRNVPWDQAIDVVLQAKGLGMDRQGNIIRVAPLADLEKEREMAIARRQQELQLAPLETRLIPVSYAHAADIQERAQDLLSGRGSIAVDERTNVMVVRDVAGNLDQIEELTRSLDTQTPQVLIEARIVEATSRYLRDVGVQWGGDASFSAATGNPTGLAFPSAIGIAGGASDQDTPTAGLSPFQSTVQNPNFAVNLPAAVGTGKGGALGLTFGSIDSNFNIALRLSAAETSGMLRILSSPRVLTLDNKQARISQGTLIPFSQVSAQGVQTTFQEAKLQLLVRPHVTADGSVSMHVKINRDEPDFNQTSPRGDPTILKREAETELLVADGHTAVIGGIFTRNTGRNVDQVPFFGDIPLLGLLFQKRTASDTRGELVIFLTPRIVNRAEALGR
jgi:type IV pilus assembly protein PilQ